ncbi:hypothetical protein L1987_85565 [Smallanthus sonchifolius]|uniref:Uncharacterized protein n=1 Tax=Smallanthus sonchifolius TaxID=185202 RepID=A0ACB8XW80_9ASTR|nr:hypothetical protein L1987_85565 [Smallanthus sonchifolius]
MPVIRDQSLRPQSTTTFRDRKYPRGRVPSRRTKNFGFWRASQKYTTVYHGSEAVGCRTSLAYFDDNRNKTQWLMLEYTTNDPNLPIGTDDNKLSDWVLCKVYKNGMIRNKTNSMMNNNQFTDSPSQEQNQLDNEPPTKRPRVSVNLQVVHIQPNGPVGNVVTPTEFMYQQPVDNIDRFCLSCPPQILHHNQATITQTRMDPNFNLMGSSSLQPPLDRVFASEEPYSGCYAMGRNSLTYTDGIHYPTPLNWTNNTDEDQTSWTLLTVTPDEEPTPVTSTDGLDEDLTSSISPNEEPTPVTWINSLDEDPTSSISPNEEPTPVTWINSLDEHLTSWNSTVSPTEEPTAVTWINSLDEDLTWLTSTLGPKEEPTLAFSPYRPHEDSTLDTSAYDDLDEQIASLLRNM